MRKRLFCPLRVATALSLLVLLACGSAGDETAQKPAAEPGELATTDQGVTETPENTESDVPELQEIPVDTPATPAPKPKPKPKHPESQPEVVVQKEPDPPPPPATVSIPAATTVGVTLDRTLRTDSNQVDDRFTARTTAAIVIDGKTAIPAGATLRGRLTAVEEPHRTSGRASMTLQFEEYLADDGRIYKVLTRPITVEAEPDKISDEKKVAAGGLIGGVIGALTSKKKGKGAAIGAVIGAAAGGAAAVATKGKQLEIDQGHEFNLEIVQPVVVPVIKDGASESP